MNKDYIKNTIETRLNNNATITFREVNKNGVIKEGIEVKKRDSSISPIIYFNPDNSDDEIVDCVIDCLSKDKNLNINTDEFLNNIYDWNWAKTRIYPRLYNVDRNDKADETVNLTLAGDISMCFSILISNTGEMSTKVLNHMLNMWNITIDDLKKAAKENLNKELIFDSIFNVMSGKSKKERTIDLSDIMTVGTISNKPFGASVVLLLADLINNGEIEDRDYYILPSSIHEIILLKEYNEYFKEMVKDVNSTVVNPEAFLSDNVFKYNASTQEIEVVY